MQRRNAALVRVDGGLGVGFDQVEDLGVPDEPGLDDLGEAGDGLVRRQRVEQVEVADDRARRPERADQVLALGGVDRRSCRRRRHRPCRARSSGTCTTCTPRSQVAATKPARSVTAPPPKPTTASVRVKSAWPMTCQQNAATSTRLPCSASGISASSTSRVPSDMSRSRSCAAARRERRRVDDEHLARGRGERLADAIQDAAADGDVVARVAASRRWSSCPVMRAPRRPASVLRPRDDLGDDAPPAGPVDVSKVTSATSS